VRKKAPPPPKVEIITVTPRRPGIPSRAGIDCRGLGAGLTPALSATALAQMFNLSDLFKYDPKTRFAGFIAQTSGC
jgi:hypothetical protein